MTDWRTMMQDSFSPMQKPQNPQRGSCPPSSDHFEDFEDTHSQAGTVIEPVCCPGGQPLPPIYWERYSAGIILGPAQPEFFARDGKGLNETYWIVARYEGRPIWINAEALRSKQAFEQQKKMRVVEPVRW